MSGLHTKSIDRGIYFLASDSVIELVMAFLNSLRESNPDIPLCLIPFNKDIHRLLKLKDGYNFSIYPDGEKLLQCDEISRWFHAHTVGHYRKLAPWEGPFDEFIYIDVDTLVLKDLSFVFNLLANYDFLTSKSNIEKDERWVWKPSIHNTGLIDSRQISFAANTGFIASKKALLSIDSVLKLQPLAQELRPHLELFCMEQPFLNYLIVTSKKRFSSLYNLLDTDELPENIVEYWTGYHSNKMVDGRQLVEEKGASREIFLFHWAGEWQLRKFDHRLFSTLHRLRLRKKPWPVRLFMPNRSLWKHYRNLNWSHKGES